MPTDGIGTPQVIQQPPAPTGSPWPSSGDILTAAVALVVGVAAFLAAVKSWRAAEGAARAAEAAATATEKAATASYRAAVAGEQAAAANQTMAVEAERLRREQSQPYVVVFADQLPAMRYVIDLVIKNFGSTAAHDIKVEIAPPPRRAFVDDAMTRDVWLPTEIPVLVPGQEWRTRWDVGAARKGADLPDKHEAIVTFTDSKGRGPDDDSERFSYSYVLDWAMYWGQIGMGEPDIARSIRDGLEEIVGSIDRLTRRE